MLTGHPKITDLHEVVLGNQTVSGCQIPLGRKEQQKQNNRDKDEGKVES